MCERGSARVLGVQVLGEGATDLVHLGQAAIATARPRISSSSRSSTFPTMTEAYRIAAFDVMKQRLASGSAPRRSGTRIGLIAKIAIRCRRTRCT